MCSAREAQAAVAGYGVFLVAKTCNQEGKAEKVKKTVSSPMCPNSMR